MLNKVERLKLDLLADGITVSAAARLALGSGGRDRPLTLADYASTSGIGLRLHPDIWVNAPVAAHNPNFVVDSPHRLEWDGEKYFVESAEFRAEVEPIPVPLYSSRLNSLGQVFSSHAITHTDRVRISPVQGCAVTCTFCDLPYKQRYHKYPAEALIEAVSAALADPILPARHVLISGGTPKPEDYSYELDIYERVCAAFPTVPIDVMMLPANGLLDPRQLKSVGINELSVNIELYNETFAKKFMHAKWRIGIAGYLEFIDRAVRIFGFGRIRSLIVVGLEPLDDTLKGVEALCQRGCVPVLSPFRPDPATPLGDLRPPTTSELAAAYERCREVAERHNLHLGPGCIPCHHNVLAFPDGSDYYFNS